MPYTKMEEVNPAIRGIKPSVTLAQANLIAEWADAMEAAEDGPESPWAAAIAQFKKLYTVEDGKWVKKESTKALDYDTTVIAFGDAVKALKDNHLGGYLVRFSDENAPDLTGDFFTNSTDFGFTERLTSPIYLNHTAPLKTRDGKSVAVKEAIGKVTLTMDDMGILTDAVLFNRERYEAMLDSLGWSSGTAAHLVQREAAGKAQHITRWPLGLDASLTPIPAEPSNKVMPFKSLFTPPEVGFPRAAVGFTPEVEPESAEMPEGGGNPPAETDDGPTEAQAPPQVGQQVAVKAAIEITLSEIEIMEV